MSPSPSAKAPYPLLLLFVVLATAIAALAYRYHVAQKDAVGHDVHKQLLTIADMKVKHISAWRAEKLGEIRVMLHSRLTLSAVQRLVQGRIDARERAYVLNWMDALSRELHYAGITLTDPEGRIVVARGRQFGSLEHIRTLAVQVAATNDVTLTDFHLNDSGAPVHLGLNVPLRIEPGAPVFAVLL